MNAVQTAALASAKRRQLKIDVASNQESPRKRRGLALHINVDTEKDTDKPQPIAMPCSNSADNVEMIQVANDGPANLQQDTMVLHKLGRGAGGTVYIGLYEPLLKPVAVKQVSVFDHEERQMITHELHALQQNLC